MKKTIKAFAFVMFLVFVLTSCNGGGRSTSSNADTQEIIKEIYPKPQNASFGGDTFFLDKVNLKISADADVFAAERLCAELNKNGIEIDPSNSAPITLYLGHDDSIKKEIGAAKFGFASEPEGYKISVKEDKIVLLGADADGDFNAVASFCQLLNNGYIAQCEVSDYPTVPMRGVIEGFYGTPWSHADRLSMLDFMGDFKMNTMIFAPKDDLKHLSGWREYYTSEELAVFKELLSGANKNHVDFVYAISPGGDFAKGGAYAKDFDTLMKKCESLYDIGVRNFAIFLDDIYIENDSAALHAKLLNDFQVKFCETHEGCADLLTIPTVFNATDISWGGVYLQYVEELAKLLNPKVMVMSTGSAVIPAAITKEDMSAVNAPYKRKAVIWWNYPVNDYATDSLFVAPATGLSVDLPEEILGLTANPMNQAEASQIPLATTAD
ncbi:MAG: beta-N-acetylglucosaminidase domain-containing protein, partial [Oscillospiraceae bacterium]|nr:beta-N-acetylglucosaminidase domain-containing protein [Oscillospiraceae bacterium]